MMTYPQLVALERSLRDDRVLSVYLHGAVDDPAARLVWRTELDRSLRDLRRWLLGSPHEEREAFERSVETLGAMLAPYASGLSSPGWAGFITGETVHDAERLPVPMPTMAIWSNGMCIAPYIRALKVTRPVIVGVVDSRVAHIYRFHLGELDPVSTIHAHAAIGETAHMGDAPIAGFHPGVRGETARDAVQRAHATGTERMLREAELVVARHAAVDAGILVGGNPRVAARFRRALARAVSDRVLQLHTLHADATPAEIMAAAKTGASALRDAADLRRIDEILGLDTNRGAAAVGPDATLRSLSRLTVRELYLTPRYLEDHMAEAEEAVRQALDQGASVEQVSGAAAAALDQHGGMAAWLRYRAVGVPADGSADVPNAVASRGAE
jgi:hypothetical protein